MLSFPHYQAPPTPIPFTETHPPPPNPKPFSRVRLNDSRPHHLSTLLSIAKRDMVIMRSRS